MLTLAADVGGTFTDLILVDQQRGRVFIDKVPTGARGSAGGIAPGIQRIVAGAGREIGEIGLFVHGFTVATNAFLMRAGAPAALVTSAGMGDVLEIGGQMRPRTFALLQSKPAPVIPRQRVIEVRERIDAFGGVAIRLDDEEIARAVAVLREMNPPSVAISLMFSFLCSDHEKALAAAIARALPAAAIYCSHEINPQMEEWPRASTTAMAAYVGPIVASYVDELESLLGGLGFRGALRFMRSDGGVATPRATRQNPGHMLTSGLAGGVIAATRLGRDLGRRDVIALDVGGTSADLAAIVGGVARPRMARMIDGQPVRLPTIDVETISNGGGSIAWVDPGGALRVGPLSAGAVPGPACYGQGGDRPTVTDAAVVLGWLAPEDYLDGEVSIDPGAAHDAIERDVARALGIAVADAAFGIVRVANAMLVQSIRTLCVERGLDVRGYSLFAFGGAGPLYGGMIARDLGMAEVVVPRHPGVFAAEGLLAADIRHMAQTPFRAALEQVAPTALQAVLGELRHQMEAELVADGVPAARRSYRFLGDLRYVGQFHEILVDLPDYLAVDYDAAVLTAHFHRQHAAQYGHADPKAPVEIVNLRIEASGRMDPPDVAGAEPAQSVALRPTRYRPALFGSGTAPLDTMIVDRAAVTEGQRIAGPAIIVQRDSTTVVLPGQVALAGALGVLQLREVLP